MRVCACGDPLCTELEPKEENKTPMNKYDLDEDGVPLVPYLPDECDQVPVPPQPHERGSAMSEHSSVHCNNSTVLVDSIYAHTADEYIKFVKDVTKDMEEWKEKAKAAGHKHAYLVCDGNWFWPVYKRRATLEDISRLKQEAREELEETAEILERINTAKAFLKQMGEDPDDK